MKYTAKRIKSCGAPLAPGGKPRKLRHYEYRAFKIEHLPEQHEWRYSWLDGERIVIGTGRRKARVQYAYAPTLKECKKCIDSICLPPK